MKDMFIAQTPAQARLLQDMAYVNILGRLLQAEASAAEVATAAGQTLQAAHHRLTKLLKAGLIEVRAERKRGGRPVKVYGAVAREFRVRFALTDAATIGELIREAHRPLLEAHYQTISRVQREGRDLKIQRNEQGRMELTLDDEAAGSGDAAETVCHSVFLGYRLPPRAAKELEERLAALAEWMAEQSVARDEAGEDYLLGLLLAPGKLDST